MRTVQEQRGHTFMNSIDSTEKMVAKAAPAISLSAVSVSEDAHTWLDHFAALPWGAISGCAATLYTVCMLGDWVYKKVRAYRMWRASH